MGTTVKVHRRKLASTGPKPQALKTARAAAASAAKTLGGARDRLAAAGRRAAQAVEARAAKASDIAGAGAPALRGADGAGAAMARPLSFPPLAEPGGAPVKAATSEPLTMAEGAFLDNPVIAERARRGAYPLEAPSWPAFRRYLSDHTELNELRERGLPAAMRAHGALALAVFALGAFLVVTLVALIAWFCLAPTTADADSPYAAAEVTEQVGTPQEQWKAGTVPSLYQSDPAWGSLPYGQATMAAAGAAPTALAMASVAVRGDASRTPADFAQWATDHDLTAAGADTLSAYLTRAGADFGLALEPVGTDARSLRRAIVGGAPVIVVTQPGTFSPVASAVVLDDIDASGNLVLHDPTSAARSAKSWEFDDITAAAARAFSVHAA